MIKKNKLCCVLVILIILLNFSFELISYGFEIEKAHLVKVGEAENHLKYYREDRGIYTYLKCSIVGYFSNNQFYPAYCMNRDLPGAETNEYDVNINEVLQNNKVWRVIKNGYPYKTYVQMGLNSEYDAFCVTKMAVYCVLGQANIDYFTADENDTVGLKMLNVLRNLVEIGENGTETMLENYLKLEKVGELEKENNYYIQKYKIESQIESKEEYNVKLTNNENIIVEKIDNENFKISIPENMVSDDIELIFEIEKSVKNYPIFYGETKIPGTQDYIITTDTYTLVNEIFKSKIETNKSKIEVLKIDKETKLPINNTKIELLDSNGKMIKEAITDNNGKIIFENLYKGIYKLKEIEANENYILNNNEYEINLEYNKTEKVQIENEHKKGNVKILKFDKDNNKLTLGGIEFELYNIQNELIGKYTSNLNGEIEINNINIGKYYLREIEAKNGYEKLEDIEFEVKYNETVYLEIGNEKTKGKVKVIKVDKDNNEIKLEGVEFVVLDENKNIVDRLITDKNGEATSKELPIYKEEYVLKEIKTKEEYILDDSEIQINLDSNIIDTKIIENEIKKGKIKILKVDYDTFNPIENVEFSIINLTTGEKVDSLQTNKNGEAISKQLPINAEYKIVESKKIDGYKENNDEIIVNLKWNEETKVQLTNEKEKGRIKIIKVDKDDQNLKLSGVKFELYNGDSLLEVITTNEVGEGYSKWLYSYNQKYYLIEIEGKEGYKLNNEKIEFELFANKTIDLIIKNEKEELEESEEKVEEVVEIKKLPKTGY